MGIYIYGDGVSVQIKIDKEVGLAIQLKVMKMSAEKQTEQKLTGPGRAEFLKRLCVPVPGYSG